MHYAPESAQEFLPDEPSSGPFAADAAKNFHYQSAPLYLLTLVVGVLVGATEVLILFLVAISVSGAASIDHPTMSQDIHSATLSGPLLKLTPTVKTLFGPVLPSNLTTHFSQNAVVITPPV